MKKKAPIVKKSIQPKKKKAAVAAPTPAAPVASNEVRQLRQRELEKLPHKGKDGMDNAAIARANQIAEPPPPKIERKCTHEVNVGDTVCYFADIDNQWQVTWIHPGGGSYLRATKMMREKDGVGRAEQYFITDTMIPLELARLLPRKPTDAGSPVRARPWGNKPKGPRKSRGGNKTAPLAKNPGTNGAEPAPKLPRTPHKRSAHVKGTSTPKQKKEAVAYCTKLREESGVCAAIRETAAKFSTMTRDEIIEVAAAVGINRSTASIQFGQARS